MGYACKEKIQEAADDFVRSLGSVNRHFLASNLTNVESNSDAMKALKAALAKTHQDDDET